MPSLHQCQQQEHDLGHDASQLELTKRNCSFKTPSCSEPALDQEKGVIFWSCGVQVSVRVTENSPRQCVGSIPRMIWGSLQNRFISVNCCLRQEYCCWLRGACYFLHELILLLCIFALQHYWKENISCRIGCIHRSEQKDAIQMLILASWCCKLAVGHLVASCPALQNTKFYSDHMEIQRMGSIATGIWWQALKQSWEINLPKGKQKKLLMNYMQRKEAF